MFSDTNPGAGSSALQFVTCDLLSISECICCQSEVLESDIPGSSTKRKARFKPQLDPEPADSARAKCLLLLKPTVIDRLISESRTALEEMEGRRSVGKRLVAPLSAANRSKASGNSKEAGKRKRVDSLNNGSSPAVKRLRNSKGGSESDSSSSRNASSERKGSRTSEKPVKTSNVDSKPAEKRVICKNNPDEKSVPSPKKLRKSEKSRFSKRIRFPSSSLRSGKKRMELLNRKKIVKHLSKDSRDKTRRTASDKTDSNSNVCTENDSNDETIDNSTDSEVSRGPEFFDNKDKEKCLDDDNKRRKRRRKRDSMWVKKVKKQLKVKPDTSDKSLPPPALGPFIEKVPNVNDELPVLDDSCSLDFLGGDQSSSLSVSDDVPMPMLEKEVEIDVNPEPKVPESSFKINEGISEKEIKFETSKDCNNLMKTFQINEKIQSPEVFSDQEILKSDISSFEKANKSIPSPCIKVKAQESDSIQNLVLSDLSLPILPGKNTPFETELPKLHSKSIQDNEITLPEIREESKVDISEDTNYSETLSLRVSCEASISPSTENSEVKEISSEGIDKVELNLCEQNTQIKQVLYEENGLHALNSPISVKNEIPMEVNELKLFGHIENHSLPNDSESSIVSNPKYTTDVFESQNVSTIDARNLTNPDDISSCLETSIQSVTEKNCDNTPSVISETDSNDYMNCKTIEVPELKVIDCNEKPDVGLSVNDLAISHSIKITETDESAMNSVSNNLIEDTEIHSNDHNKENVEGLLPNMLKDTSPELVEDHLVSSQIVEEEITKLEEVLCKNSKQTSDSDEITLTEHNVKYSELKKENKDLQADDTIQECVAIDTTIEADPESKSVSLLDADSTSDVKPQSLDDSFGDFSLSLPEDLDSASVPSDDEREEEMEILPDSTECERSEETSKEIKPINEVASPNEPPVEEITPNNNINENSSKPSPSPEEIASSENKIGVGIGNGELDISECRILKQELPEDKPLAGSTPRRPSTEEIKEMKLPEIKKEVLTVEQRQMKESVLQALGLKSLTSTSSQPPPEEKPKRDGYTGTLKAVIKLNRSGDKKKMVYQRSEDSVGELEYRICSEIPATDGVPITHLNDIAGIRKSVSKLHHESDYNIGTATSNGHSNDHDTISFDDSKNASGGKDLIIPEKSSSFSIHPGRLCSDVCTYCFGKFGCLDTPCHVAALKPERQKKILENEQHLTAESCLCDACYRYVDRKANCPSKSSSGGVTKPRVKPPASTRCCVNGCQEQATHTVKKKWLIKLKRSITNKLDIDLDKPGAMYVPLCAQHHYWVDYFTVCGICRKRLNRNHLFSLGSETDKLNLMLAEDGIPARLSDKLFLCKLCRYYSNLRLKYSDPGSIPSSGQIFYRDYRRKILTSFDIPVSDSEDEPPLKDEKKKSTNVKKISSDPNVSSNGASASSKSDESVMALSNLATLLGDQSEQQARIQVKFGNVNIGRLSNLNIGQGGREERLPYSDVGLQASLEFERSSVPDESWERCVANIQFDKRTKVLWQDLQRPYGNQSSFLRHLVMLEKYWRAGHLILAPNTDERVAKYLNGVKNRIKSFEGSSCDINKQPSPAPVSTAATSSVSSSEKFPLITNTGEIEVTPISMVQKRSTSTPIVQMDKKPMTPLDRAKSLVRMVPPTPRQHVPLPIQRFQMPVYVSPYAPRHYPPASSPHQRPPPLLKIRNKGVATPPPYYHQIHQAPMLASQPLKPILPKLPSALTVTHVPQGGAAITLNRSGITIEKQSGTAHVTPSLPIEKPSISVFREPAPGPP